MPRKTAPKDVTTATEWVVVNDVTTDPLVNTRPVYYPWVTERTGSYDPKQLGIPVVSERADGTQIWIDGQNRAALLKAVDLGDSKIQCEVYRGLTIAQEAALFLGRNDNRAVGTVYRYLARVTAGDPDAVAVNTIVIAAGWRVSDRATDHTICAVGALEKVYAGDRRELRPDEIGPEFALENTLRAVTEAWGYQPDTVNGEILKGVGAVLNHYWDQVDIDNLVKKLRAQQGGANGLLGAARGRRQFQGGSLATCATEQVLEVYNRGRRTRVLDTWRR